MEAEPQPSTSPATRAHTARGNIITQAVLDSQERIARALEAFASTIAKIHDTLTQKKHKDALTRGVKK